MKNCIELVMKKVRQMDVMDFGIFKVCLISFGILLGVFHRKTFKRSLPLIKITFLASFVYLIKKILSEQCKKSL